MLLREKAFLILSFILATIILVDVNTQIGNRLWEKVKNRSDRFSINEGKNIGFINLRGRLVIPPKYQDSIHYFNNSLIPVQINNQWGYINKDGKMMIEPKFSWAGEFSEGLAVVSLKGDFINRFGYINLNGEYAIKPQFMEARAFSREGLAAVKYNNLWGYIDRTGQLIIRPQFQDVRGFQDNLAPVKKGGKWGYIEKSGLTVILFQWDDAKEFYKGIAAVKKNNLWGFINREGAEVIPFQFKNADNFKDGFSVIQRQDHFGILDASGTIIFEKDYILKMRPFSEGLSAVQVNRKYHPQKKGKWGYINSKGQWVIQPQFDLAWDFHGGLARVGIDKNNPLRGYVNTKGKLIWDPGDWQLSNVIQKVVGNIIILVGLIYVNVLYQFNRSKRKRVKLLLQIRKKYKGQLIGFGFFSEPRVKFYFNGVSFLLYSMDPFGFNYQSQTILESESVFKQDLYKSIYIHLERLVEEGDYIEPSITLQLNEKFLTQNSLLQKLSDHSILQEIFKLELKNLISSYSAKEFEIKLSLIDGCFQMVFYGLLSDEKEYDWFLDIGKLAFESFQELDTKILQLFQPTIND